MSGLLMGGQITVEESLARFLVKKPEVTTGEVSIVRALLKLISFHW
jgi:hypothetical protein